MAINNTGLVANTAVTIFTAGSQTVISSMYLCNYSGGNVQVDIHAIPGNLAAATDTNVIYKNYLIGSYDTLVLDTERLILNTGDVISVVCNVSSVTATVSSFDM